MFQTKRTGGVFAAMFRFCPDEAKQKGPGLVKAPACGHLDANVMLTS